MIGGDQYDSQVLWCSAILPAAAWLLASYAGLSARSQLDHLFKRSKSCTNWALMEFFLQLFFPTIIFVFQSSRVEAISLVGSLLCFPELLPDTPVFVPVPNEYNLTTCGDIKVRNNFLYHRFEQRHLFLGSAGSRRGFVIEIGQKGSHQRGSVCRPFQFGHLHLLSVDSRDQAREN